MPKSYATRLQIQLHLATVLSLGRQHESMLDLLGVLPCEGLDALGRKLCVLGALHLLLAEMRAVHVQHCIAHTSKVGYQEGIGDTDDGVPDRTGFLRTGLKLLHITLIKGQVRPVVCVGAHRCKN